MEAFPDVIRQFPVNKKLLGKNYHEVVAKKLFSSIGNLPDETRDETKDGDMVVCEAVEQPSEQPVSAETVEQPVPPVEVETAEQPAEAVEQSLPPAVKLVSKKFNATEKKQVQQELISLLKGNQYKSHPLFMDYVVFCNIIENSIELGFDYILFKYALNDIFGIKIEEVDTFIELINNESNTELRSKFNPDKWESLREKYLKQLVELHQSFGSVVEKEKAMGFEQWAANHREKIDSFYK